MEEAWIIYIYSRMEQEIPTKEQLIERMSDNIPSTSPEAMKLAFLCVEKLQEAIIIAKRLEWWMSGDDGDESFEKRLKEELKYDLLTKT